MVGSGSKSVKSCRSDRLLNTNSVDVGNVGVKVGRKSGITVKTYLKVECSVKISVM